MCISESVDAVCIGNPFSPNSCLPLRNVNFDFSFLRRVMFCSISGRERKFDRRHSGQCQSTLRSTEALPRRHRWRDLQQRSSVRGVREPLYTVSPPPLPVCIPPLSPLSLHGRNNPFIHSFSTDRSIRSICGGCGRSGHAPIPSRPAVRKSRRVAWKLVSVRNPTLPSGQDRAVSLT